MKLLLKRIDSENGNSFKLGPGDHVIGRGALLQCASRRVSRNHGLLRIVPSDGVYLISTHVNPCFHQAYDTKHLQLVKQGFSMLLNDGDIIALLPEEYWYKVQIIKDVKDDKPPENEANGGSVVLKNHKREADETDGDAVIKRRKSSDVKSEAGSSGGPCAANETIVVPSGCVEKMEVIELEDDSEESGGSPCFLEENEALEDWKESPEAIEIIDSVENNLPDILKDQDSGGNNIKVEDSDNMKENDSGGNNMKGKEDSGGNNIKEEIKEESISLTPDCINGENLPEDAIEAKVFKKEKLVDVMENDVPIRFVEEKVDETSEINEDEVMSNLSDTTENQNEETSKEEEENPKGNCDNRNEEDNKTITVVDVNQPSTSGTLRRERCWYGSSCYRKNLQHKADFSHPGDTDYNSDPNDSRPECGYGTACYRRNKLHRQHYKHTTQGTRPPSPTQTNPPPNPPPKKRQQKKKGTDYELNANEDEYDYSDPFIDDESSDEFQLSSTADSSDDDDDEDESQEESQERKRMMKEAKKFMKRKK